MSKPKILICSVIRDKAPMLKFFLSQIAGATRMLSEDFEINLSIYENDSIDGTKELLNTVKMGDHFEESIIRTDNLGTNKYDSVISNDRIKNLCKARNNCLDQFEQLDQMDYIIWADADCAWSNDILNNLMDRMITSNMDIASAYSLHGDIERPQMELYDKWATRAKREHVWWHCSPYNFLDDEIPVYATFNGLCIYKAQPFIEGLRYKPSSLEQKEDVEHISICEGFREKGFDKILIIKHAHVLHFSNCNNFEGWLQNQTQHIEKE